MNNDYYQARINQAIQYLSTHWNEELSVADLAKAANFSTFHFQRIYRSLQGESPYDTLIRFRIERAIATLRYDKKSRISAVANECGFSSPEHFTRLFKSRYDCSPSAYRKNPEMINSTIHQEKEGFDFYSCVDKQLLEVEKNFKVTIEEWEEIPVYMIRAIFGEDGSILIQRYQELIDWAEKNNIPYQGPMKRFGMSLDDMDVTPSHVYRYDYAIASDREVDNEGLIEKSFIPGGTYASVHCQGDLTEVTKAWDYLYKKWLPNSEFIPRHYPAIEEFIKGPEEIGWTTFDIKCRIPVRLVS